VTLPAAYLPALRARLDALYGARLVRAVLFGSYARGEATPESDVDVLVVLRGHVSAYDEAWATSEIDVDLMERFGLVTNFVAISEETARESWPLLRNVREDGIPVLA
jgi:uncharacterized protein